MSVDRICQSEVCQHRGRFVANLLVLQVQARLRSRTFRTCGRTPRTLDNNPVGQFGTRNFEIAVL